MKNTPWLFLIFVWMIQMSRADPITRELPEKNLYYELSREVRAELQAVSEYISPINSDDKEDLVKAREHLDKLSVYCENKCNFIEKSYMYRFYAYISYQEDKLQESFSYYQKVYALSPEIPIAVEIDALNSLHMIGFSMERYKESLKYLKLKLSIAPKANQGDKEMLLYLSGKVDMIEGDYTAAKENISKALELLKQAGKVGLKYRAWNEELNEVLERLGESSSSDE